MYVESWVDNSQLIQIFIIRAKYSRIDALVWWLLLECMSMSRRLVNRLETFFLKKSVLIPHLTFTYCHNHYYTQIYYTSTSESEWLCWKLKTPEFEENAFHRVMMLIVNVFSCVCSAFGFRRLLFLFVFSEKVKTCNKNVSLHWAHRQVKCV